MTKQNKIKRISLIRQLGRLEDTHCEPCTVRLVPQGELDRVCKDCPIYKQIRTIGNELNALGSKVKPQTKKVLMTSRKLIDNAITVDKYLGYKNKGYTDDEISSFIGFNRCSIRRWKKKNGLTERGQVK